MSCKSSNKDEYSIWLTPNNPIYQELSNIINRLADKYNCLKFPPHLTLIGPLTENKENVFLKTIELASKLKPLEVSLNGIKHFNEFYRCLFIKAIETPKLIEANKKAQEIFKKGYDYFPHLSLMYREENTFPSEIKEKIISEVKHIPKKFTVDSLDLYYTGHDLDSWYKIERFRLKE